MGSAKFASFALYSDRGLDLTTRQEVTLKIAEHQHGGLIASVEQLVAIWEKETGKPAVDGAAGLASKVKGYKDLYNDLAALRTMLKDLGITAEAQFKTGPNGNRYVIFKGYAGLRKYFTGTRYLASNPKIVDMAIGRVGAAKKVLKGAKVTVVFTVAIDIVRYVFEDKRTLSWLVGTIASDLLKVGISTGIGVAAGAAVATVTTLAAGPLIAVIAAGVLTGWALDALDKELGLTDKLISMLDDVVESIEFKKRQIEYEWYRFDRYIIDSILSGRDPMKGILY